MAIELLEYVEATEQAEGQRVENFLNECRACKKQGEEVCLRPATLGIPKARIEVNSRGGQRIVLQSIEACRSERRRSAVQLIERMTAI